MVRCTAPFHSGSLFGCRRCSRSHGDVNSHSFSLYSCFLAPTSFALLSPVSAEILPLMNSRISLWFYCANQQSPRKMQKTPLPPEIKNQNIKPLQLNDPFKMKFIRQKRLLANSQENSELQVTKSSKIYHSTLGFLFWKCTSWFMRTSLHTSISLNTTRTCEHINQVILFFK